MRVAASRLVDADGDEARVGGAGGVQDVEAGAVAVVDLEAELGGRLDHLDVGVDRSRCGSRGRAAAG